MTGSRMKSGRSIAFAAGIATGFAGIASADLVVATTQDNRILSFNHGAPGSILSNVPITGLQPNENVLGIDLRPLTTGLVILGSSNRLYTVDRLTGAASPIGAGPFAPALNTAEHGVDFNPTVDRVRVVDSTGANRRLNPVDGTAVPGDTALTYAGSPGVVPRAVGTAYVNNILGFNTPVGQTRQFIIDSSLDILGEVGSMAGGNASFNGGIVTQRGGLGVDTSDSVGFDIYAGLQLVSLTNPSSNVSSLYTINIETGATQLIGGIGTSLTIRDIAIVPAPGTLGALAGAGVLAIARRRRRD